MSRRLSIAIPARNEGSRIERCLAAVAESLEFAGQSGSGLVVLANNCTDDTVERAQSCCGLQSNPVFVCAVALPEEKSHAGWARRLALDAAADLLFDSRDVILSTDADTVVAKDWVPRNLAHLDNGYDAVAGSAWLDPADLRTLPPPHRRRLALVRRYGRAVDFLKSQQDLSEPWPRHFYEGGASMALTLGAYRAIGGAPTPSVGEDKALFDAVRRAGGKVRHANDVRVRTSARLIGRAAGGASDILALWGRQSEDEPAASLETIAASLGRPGASRRGLSFRDLPLEIERARSLVGQARASRALASAG